jgi:hydrogenase nickel incorporation protein HypA/HybF
MHERGLAVSILRAAEDARRAAEARRVVALRVRLGGPQPPSPEHVRWHFEQAAAGTAVEGARLELIIDEANTDAVALDAIEVED